MRRPASTARRVPNDAASGAPRDERPDRVSRLRDRLRDRRARPAHEGLGGARPRRRPGLDHRRRPSTSASPATPAARSACSRRSRPLLAIIAAVVGVLPRAHGAPDARPAPRGRALAGARRRARQPDRPDLPVARVPPRRGRRLRPHRVVAHLQRRRLRHHDRRDPRRRVVVALGARERHAGDSTPKSPWMDEELAVPAALGGGAGRPGGGPAHRLDAGPRSQELVANGVGARRRQGGGQEPPARDRRGHRAPRRADRRRPAAARCRDRPGRPATRTTTCS